MLSENRKILVGDYRKFNFGDDIKEPLIFLFMKKKGAKKGLRYSDPRKFTFGQKLFELRKKRGLTQTELAQKMGTTLRGISYYEREAQNPTMDVIERAAKALEVPKKYFLEENVKVKIQETPPVIKSLKSTLPKLSALSRNEQESLALVINSFLEKRRKAG